MPSSTKAEGTESLLEITVKKHSAQAPRLATRMEDNIPEGFTIFSLPAAHRRRLRGTNMLERLNREIKRRTRVATLFPDESSLLSLVSAVLMEVSEEWESGRCIEPEMSIPSVGAKIAIPSVIATFITARRRMMCQESDRSNSMIKTGDTTLAPQRTVP